MMFDEKSPIWIKIYKGIIIVMAALILLGGFIYSKEESTWYSYGSHFDFGQFLVMFALFVLAAGVELVSGMLMVNFLNNVQVIREKLESMN